MTYADFLASKTRHHKPAGRPCEPDMVHPMLHGWQRDITAWAVRTGRAAIWADTGLGKTFMQLEWARLSGTRTLIVAPLAVCQQTIREAAKLGIAAHYKRGQDNHDDRITVTNYEMADRFNPAEFDAVVLDEASILKQHDGVTRTKLITQFATVPRRLACTATPAPNDVAELANQAEFLGASTRVEMLAAYFVNDPKTKGWRLKGHARRPMADWMSSWALAVRRPSDLGYPDDGYDLPPLRVIAETVPTAIDAIEGQLFTVAGDLGGVGGRAKVRKATVDARCERAAKLVLDEPDEPWLIWCGLNSEADRLRSLIPNAVEVRGNQTPEQKAEAILAFADSKIQRLIIKPSIAAHGINWQHCARMALVGLSDSWEAYYQAIRRCWRYGQTRPVHAHVVLSDLEGPIADNVARKEQEAARLMGELVAAMRGVREGVAA